MGASVAVLLIIDMLVDFFDRHPGLAAQRQRLATAINELTRAFRSLGLPVIWVREEFKPDLSDGSLEMRRLGVAGRIAGSEGAKILPELERAGTDREIVKKRYSAFFGTNLDEILGTVQPSLIVTAGINTHACVRTTVIDAYQRDYQVVIARECVASHDAEHHDITLRYLDGKMARVLTNTDLIRLLSSAAV